MSGRRPHYVVGGDLRARTQLSSVVLRWRRSSEAGAGEAFEPWVGQTVPRAQREYREAARPRPRHVSMLCRTCAWLGHKILGLRRPLKRGAGKNLMLGMSRPALSQAIVFKGDFLHHEICPGILTPAGALIRLFTPTQDLVPARRLHEIARSGRSGGFPCGPYPL